MRSSLLLLAALVCVAASPVALALDPPGLCDAVLDPVLHNLCANVCEVLNNTPPAHPRLPC
jgi:hypothetical protein